MPDWLLQGLLSGAVAGALAFGALRVEIRLLKRTIEAAHDRLDKINAPAARVRL